MESKQQICPHVEEMWINGTNSSIPSNKNQEKSFKTKICNLSGKICETSDNFTDCYLWEKKDKE